MAKNLATWFSPSLGVKQRSKGASAVAAAAYRACVKLTDERTGITHDYTKKQGHVKTFTVGPFDDINELWQAAEKKDTRVNSVVARELIVPLPSEWDDSQREKFVREFAEYLRAKYGVAVQVSLHRQNNNNKNEHAHIMFTTREVGDDKTFGEKTRSLDLGRDKKDKAGNVIEKGELTKLREHVCEMMNRYSDEYGNDFYVTAGKFNKIEGMEDHISLKHVPFVSKDKLNEKSNYDVVTKAQEHNARVIEYRKLKHESKNAKEELAQIECDIENDLTREDEQRQKHAVNVPVVAPVVKSDTNSNEPIFIPRNWVDAHARYEELTTQRSHLEKQQHEWLNQFKEKKKAEPEHEFNIFKFETRKSKERYAAWIDEMNELRGGYQECTKKLDARKTALEDETLKKNVEAYLTATAHNGRIKEERERELNARIEQIRLEREAEERFNRENPTDWGKKLDESNHSRVRTQSSNNDLTMRP